MCLFCVYLFRYSVLHQQGLNASDQIHCALHYDPFTSHHRYTGIVAYNRLRSEHIRILRGAILKIQGRAVFKTYIFCYAKSVSYHCMLYIFVFIRFTALHFHPKLPNLETKSTKLLSLFEVLLKKFF